MINRILTYVIVIAPLFAFATEPSWVTNYKTGEFIKRIETNNSYLYRGSVADKTAMIKDVCDLAIKSVERDIQSSLPWGNLIPKIQQLMWFDSKNYECFVTFEVLKKDLRFYAENSALITKIKELQETNAQLNSQLELYQDIRIKNAGSANKKYEQDMTNLEYLLRTKVKKGMLFTTISKMINVDFSIVKADERCYNQYKVDAMISYDKYMLCFSGYDENTAYIVGIIDKITGESF